MARSSGKMTLSVFRDGEWVEIATCRSVTVHYAGDVYADILGGIEPTGNVIGGPLDGADIPNGTRDGLSYRWDDSAKRWRCC